MRARRLLPHAPHSSVILENTRSTACRTRWSGSTSILPMGALRPSQQKLVHFQGSRSVCLEQLDSCSFFRFGANECEPTFTEPLESPDKSTLPESTLLFAVSVRKTYDLPRASTTRGHFMPLLDAIFAPEIS